jgi:transposase InsO family protein
VELKKNYTITEISNVLLINRSTLYYRPKVSKDESYLIDAIKEAFKIGKQTYGTRRIKVELQKESIIASRRKISRIMSNLGLVSVYTKPKYKHSSNKVTDDNTPNIVARKFDGHLPYEVIVSDLTYFQIGNKWHYLCPLLDLCGRKLIGYSVGRNKTAELVQKAFHSLKGDLRKIGVFHTDWGSEFKNKLIDDLLAGFSIKRSSSGKGNPYDNAVIESFNKTIKKDFINRHKFVDIEDFVEKMDEYMDWYNNVRLHSSLGYLTPNEWVSNAS